MVAADVPEKKHVDAKRGRHDVGPFSWFLESSARVTSDVGTFRVLP